MLNNFYLVAFGGALGASCRYGISVIFHFFLISSLWATYCVNSLGCLLIGFSLPFFMGNELWRLVVIVGFLGAFTTFSTYSMETLELFKNGQFKLAFLYIIGSIITGLLLTYLGYAISSSLVK